MDLNYCKETRFKIIKYVGLLYKLSSGFSDQVGTDSPYNDFLLCVNIHSRGVIFVVIHSKYLIECKDSSKGKLDF